MGKRMKGLSAVLIIAALIGLVAGVSSIKNVSAAKTYWENRSAESEANISKLEDGLKQLQENEQAYYDGRIQLADGKKAYAEGEQTLADGYAEYEKGKQDYADGEKELAAGKAKLEQGEKDLAAGKKKLAAGKNSLKTLKNLRDSIKKLQNSYTNSWRPGFEKVKKAPDSDPGKYVVKGNLSPKTVQNDITSLTSAITAYNAVVDLMKKHSVDEAAQKVAANSGGKLDKDTAKTIYENVKELVDGYSPEKASQVVYAQKKDTLDQFGLGASDVKYLYDKGVDQFMTDRSLPEPYRSTLTDLYNGVKELVDGYSLDKATATVAAQSGGKLDAATAKTVYGSVVKLMNGYTEDEAEEAVANATDNSASTIKTAYNTVKGMGGVDAVKKNIETLKTLKNEQMPALENGRDTIQDYILKIINGVQGNSTLYSMLSSTQKSQLKKIKSLVKNGTDQQFENGSDAFFKVALPMLNKVIGSVENQIAQGEDDLAAGKAKLAKGYKDYEAGKKELAAGAAKLAAAETQLAEGEQSLADARKQLKDGEAKLAEFEDGRDQIIDGIEQVKATEAEGGLESIASRLGSDYNYMDGDDLIISQGFVATDTARAYKGDSGDKVTAELTARAYAAIASIIASVLAIIAAILAIAKKYKGAAPLAIIAAVAAVIASIYAARAGLTWSTIAGSDIGKYVQYAGFVLAAIAAIHGIADIPASKAAADEAKNA